MIETFKNMGAVGYIGMVGVFILQACGFISVWLALGMLIYSLVTKNWKVWKKWKYVGYTLLVAIGLLIIAMVINAITNAG
jgi:hypothetical protein